MDAPECPHCGLNLQSPESTGDGWAAPVPHAEGEPPPVEQRATSFR